MAEVGIQYSPRQVADALQVSESSVKRWCDQGAINTVKTVGGHRRIPLGGLLDFLRERDHKLARPDVLGLGKAPLPLPETPTATTSNGKLCKDCGFTGALARGEIDACRKTFATRCKQLNSYAAAAEELITAAMVRFGEAWDCNEIEVYQERRGCRICQHLIQEMCDRIPPPEPDAPVAIGGTPPGDPYQLSTSLVELALREAGWAATSLGNDLPFKSLLSAIADYRPKLFWLSVSTVPDQDAFVYEFNEFSDALGPEVILLVGGRGLTDQIRPRLRYTAYCDRLTQAVDFAIATRLRSSTASSHDAQHDGQDE